MRSRCCAFRVSIRGRRGAGPAGHRAAPAAADGAALIPPADSRLDVSVTNKSSGSTTGLTCDLTMSKNRAAVELLKTQIPAGYIIGGQSLSAGVEVGKLDIFFDVDHP